jgi:hypothetical protein
VTVRIAFRYNSELSIAVIPFATGQIGGEYLGARQFSRFQYERIGQFITL